MDKAAGTARRAPSLLLLGLVAATLLCTSSPAAAQQRDPFQPLVDPGAPGEAIPGASDPEVVLPQPAPGDDPLPETGSSVSPYMGAAYILVALGSAALILARLHSRPPGHRSG